MIVLIDDDENRRKKICDIFDKERISQVNFPGEALNFVYEFKKEIDLIIVNFNTSFVYQFISQHFLESFYQKLNEKLGLTLKIPPVLIYYVKEEENLKKLKEFNLKPILFNEKDPEFPFKFSKEVETLYSNVHFDPTGKREKWLYPGLESSKKEDAGLEDIVKEITDITTIGTIIEEKPQVQEAKKEEKNYQDLKIKYDLLQKQYENSEAQRKGILDETIKLKTEIEQLKGIIEKYKEAEGIEKLF